MKSFSLLRVLGVFTAIILSIKLWGINDIHKTLMEDPLDEWIGIAAVQILLLLCLREYPQSK